VTYRERRQHKAERLRNWAEKRQQTAEAALQSQPELRHDWAFITQPGHIPARARMNASDERAFESLRKAEGMMSRAAGIEAAAEGAIYSDDPDAVEQLEARIAGLEAERARIKAYNASCRKGNRDVTLLSEKQQQDLVACAKYSPYQMRDNGAAPAYWAANLSGNINRQKKRLEQLKTAADA
jgi:uncharacterized small protein (DUF1192 family)